VCCACDVRNHLQHLELALKNILTENCVLLDYSLRNGEAEARNHAISSLICSVVTNSDTLLYVGQHQKGRTRWHSWLRHCTTRWKVAGSISDGVSGIFH
jgi:hypothetical protein